MNDSNRLTNMRDAITELRTLLEPGLLGNYSWFDAVEVIAFSPAQTTEEKVAQNIFSIFVATSGEMPSNSKQHFLDKKSKKIKDLKGWNFRVSKRSVGVDELLACIEHYGRVGVWIPQDPLQVGKLVAAPPMFCPTDSGTLVPLNAVLKNNFWSGSYVVELKDEDKSALTDLVREDALVEELSEWLTTMLPLKISRVPDRIGNVLFQSKRDFSPTMPQHGSSDGEPKFLARNKIERQQISDVATSWALWQFGEDVA